MRQATEQHAVLTVFPELGLSSYTCEDLFSPGKALLKASKAALKAVWRRLGRLAHGVGGRLAAGDRSTTVQLRGRGPSRPDFRRGSQNVFTWVPGIL